MAITDVTSMDTARLGLVRTPASSPPEPGRSRPGQFAGICPGFRLGKIRSACEHVIEATMVVEVAGV
ncbi:hypothetical protein ACFCYM_30460, partial [Streptomyces sp. NPDC056254]|uniref:hypothetical protein n=1 Tax=Streptomyces sp. NPDC056254 TaxID=3345763 RepID=UPI0035D6218F